MPFYQNPCQRLQAPVEHYALNCDIHQRALSVVFVRIPMLINLPKLSCKVLPQ